MKHRIVYLDRASLRAELRRPQFAHEWIEYPSTRDDEVVARLEGATIAITNKIPLRKGVLSKLPSLRLIAVSATGVDIIDLESCRRREITVTNVRNYAPNSVPEHVLMLMLVLRRNLVALSRDVRNGEWNRSERFCILDHRIRDLHGSTLGLIGYGALAKGVERLARTFGMNILIAEHKGASEIRAARTEFAEVLRSSDVISLHSPLSADTKNLIGAKELGLMKRDAILINAARGGLVDETALVEALRKGVIAGAGFDVLSQEPPRNGNPLLADDIPNLIVTPHVAWASDEAMQTLADQLIDNIEAFVRGEPQNVVA
jgi:glycerate dehydrogenase